MKRVVLLLLLTGTLAQAGAQSTYWQQQVDHTIRVLLNDKEHTLDGQQRVRYVNNSPDTLRFIWFHIWQNAYKHDKTAFSDQLLRNGNTDFYFSEKEQRGYTNRLDFRQNNTILELEDHPQHIDIVKVLLQQPLLPGASTDLQIGFLVHLPENFSRGGHIGQSYQVTQWYPKPAVYDKDGWHPMPYLDQGEFYSEFGNYDVQITVPANYVVAATGELQNEEEKKWLAQRTSFTWEPTVKKIKTKGGGIKTVREKYPPSFTSLKTLRYTQQQVHDFAWFADKEFIVRQDTCELPSGKQVLVSAFYKNDVAKTWVDAVGMAKRSLQFYSNEIGEYPYNTASVVQGPPNYGGGMEYPTITLLEPLKRQYELDLLIAHELGHNWFYGALASNERRHPWLDEGVNSYYEQLYAKTYSLPWSQQDRIDHESAVAKHIDQPISLASDQFSRNNYGLSVYYKGAAWMKHLRSEMGDSAFTRSMQAYYVAWKNRHPSPADFKASLEATSGQRLDSAFALLDQRGVLPGSTSGGTNIVYGFTPEAFMDPNPMEKTRILMMPAIGANRYDKFMIGTLITNMREPQNRLQFLAAPMYSVGAKKFAGLGLVNFTTYTNGWIKKIDVGVSGATFSINSFEDEEKNRTNLSMHKIVPGVRVTLREKQPWSTRERSATFKTYFISQDAFRFSRDTVINNPGPEADTSIFTRAGRASGSRTLHQLTLTVEDYRKLYPYKAMLRIESGTDFIRAAFTGNYFFNYSKGGGLSARLFAGKFIYTKDKNFSRQFATDRYHLNMSGPNGYEDYTYTDYFVGRNEFEGAASQQMMVRDGAFKVRTDLLAAKVGRTDDWLMALNLSTTIPDGINPLSVLPFEVPLKIFADIGTYAEAWKRDANTDRFLFDAGLQIPILKETVNIYIPLIYSRPFKDYIQTTLPKKHRFFRTISFSVDLFNFNPRKFDERLAF